MNLGEIATKTSGVNSEFSYLHSSANFLNNKNDPVNCEVFET